MTTQQEAAIAAIIAKYEPSITGNGYNRKYYSLETVRAMLTEALAEKAQEPVAWRSKRDVLLDAAAVFPVVLRKMWSGGDVVEWLCEEADRSSEIKKGEAK